MDPGLRPGLGKRGGDLKVELFQKVKVRISDVREESTGKRKIKMDLVN